MTDTTSYRRDDLSVDQQAALFRAAARLSGEFTGIYGGETIERFLHSSYEQFEARSTVPNFLPLLAERYARQRLTALAKVEGLRDDGRPIVLFLGWSGGSDPAQQINPAAVGAMSERGVDISTEYPKPWADEVVRAADVVITMGCGDACPIFPGKRYLDWEIDDPAGQSIEAIRPIRDEIERRVRLLLTELNVPVTG